MYGTKLVLSSRKYLSNVCDGYFCSYISATFVVELMSSANAVLRIKKFDSATEDDEVSYILAYDIG